jgi:hypothetical protein
MKKLFQKLLGNSTVSKIMTKNHNIFPNSNDNGQFCVSCNLPIEQHSTQTAIRCAQLILEGIGND